MRSITMKHTCLWTNICDLVVESYKLTTSVYQCALFSAITVRLLAFLKFMTEF